MTDREKTHAEHGTRWFAPRLHKEVSGDAEAFRITFLHVASVFNTVGVIRASTYPTPDDERYWRLLEPLDTCFEVREVERR